MILTLLEELGFKKAEAELYLALHKHGASTVSELARTSGVARRSVYDTLDELRHKGVVSQITQNNSQVYRACTPETLHELYTQRIKQLENELQNTTKHKEANTPKVELYTGRQGIKLILADILQTSNEHWSFGHLEHLGETMKYPILQFLKRKEEAGHKEKFLGEEKKEFAKIKNGEYRVLPQKHMPPTPVIIYENSVALFIETENPYTIKITHPTVAESYRQYFKKYWNEAKPIKQHD